MATEPVRAGADWLRLREPADAAARAADLVDLIRSGLPDRELVIHDLGSGSGSMARWLAPRLPGPQRWLLHDRDDELLTLAAKDPPAHASDGSAVHVSTRCCDVTRLDPEALSGAALVTASALLDMLTHAELDRLVTITTGARCPVLIALSVTGEIALTPADPFDADVAAAFNSHQRRTTDGGRLLGPDATDVAAQGIARHGHEVLVRPTPWRLGPADTGLTIAWLSGWLAAAYEQNPELAAADPTYAQRRLAQARAGQLGVVVGHQDLLARPR